MGGVERERREKREERGEESKSKSESESESESDRANDRPVNWCLNTPAALPLQRGDATSISLPWDQWRFFSPSHIVVADLIMQSVLSPLHSFAHVFVLHK